jgi:putative peptidoglycan lipid II flippase
VSLEEADGQQATSIGRASTLLASGTIVSRLLGFVSGIVLAQTLGVTGSAANTFALANQLPNNIYAIIAGGLLSAVFVPAIVRAGLHKDGGQGFINRLVTIGILLFLTAGVIATLAAPLLVDLYARLGSGDGSGFSQGDLALATAFAYWCLPQVLFYALYSLFGEVLNARGIFGPFTWAPVANNVIAISGLIAFTLVFGSGAGHSPSGSWSSGMIALIAGSATLGVAIQAFFLCFFWRRAGLTYRPDFRWRGVGLGSAGKAAAWTFGMILVTQVAGIVQSNVAAIAATPGSENASLAILRYAWLIFMLPHSIAAVSIATAYFTRMSTHKRDGRITAFREDLSSSLLQIGVIMVFASVALIVIAFPFSALFSHEGFQTVLQMAPVLIAFVIGLVPFSVLFVLRRTFYALDDTRTPFFITLFQATLFIIGALIVARMPADRIAVGIAVVTTLAGIAQTGLAVVLIRRKLGRLGGGLIVARHALFFGASLVAAVFGLAIVWALGGFAAGGFAVTSPFGAIVTMVTAGGAMAVVYLAVLTLARNSQAASIIQPVIRRIRRSK